MHVSAWKELIEICVETDVLWAEITYTIAVIHDNVDNVFVVADDTISDVEQSISFHKCLLKFYGEI